MSEERDRRAPFLRIGTMLVLVGIAAVLGSAITILVWRALQPQSGLEMRSTPSVVTAVRDLERLESASYHIERVIELTDRQRRLFGLVEATDAILLVASGDVVAGVDLSEIRDGDVTIDQARGRAVITLPHARVLHTRLDNQQTFVHSRTTDMLARRNESLESDARREAERTLERAALESGIIDRAEHNAQRTVESLVRSLGYREVEVRFQ